MALIPCPECGTSVSDKAEKCPQCAYPLIKQESIPVPEPPKPEIKVVAKEGCFLQTLNMGCIVTLVIVGIVALIIFIALISG